MFPALQKKTSERQSICSVCTLKNTKEDRKKAAVCLRTVACFKSRDVLMQISTPMSRLVGFTHLLFSSVGYWISSKKHSYIKYRYIYIYMYLYTSSPPVFAWKRLPNMQTCLNCTAGECQSPMHMTALPKAAPTPAERTRVLTACAT